MLSKAEEMLQVAEKMVKQEEVVSSDMTHMGGSINGRTQKWMVYSLYMFIQENPIRLDDLGVPLF